MCCAPANGTGTTLETRTKTPQLSEGLASQQRRGTWDLYLITVLVLSDELPSTERAREAAAGGCSAGYPARPPCRPPSANRREFKDKQRSNDKRFGKRDP